MSTNHEIFDLTANDEPRWNVLVRQYKTFYNLRLEEADYDLAWRHILESDDVCGVGAYVEGVLVAFAHYIFHTTTWDRKVCYLQDLFVEDGFRGQGIGRALIEHIASISVTNGATKFYWLTKDDNQPARMLYDRLAKFDGFIRYDYPISTESGSANGKD